MNRKEQIVEVAKEAFAHYGYEGTTLAEIAKRVGIQKPSLYNHFVNKSSLYLHVAGIVGDSLVSRMQETFEAHQGEDYETRLYLLFKNNFEFISDERDGMMYVRFMLFPPMELKSEVKQIVERTDKEIDKLLNSFYAEGVASSQLHTISERTFRTAAYVLLDGLFTETFIYEDVMDRYEEAWTVFWRGITC